jgi:uncharacterized membrane protein YadS
MYENDYSWVPTFFGGFMVMAALGGFVISLIKSDKKRLPLFQTWLFMPALLSMGLGVLLAAVSENHEPYSPILAVLIFAFILSPPWIFATCLVYVPARILQGDDGTSGTNA